MIFIWARRDGHWKSLNLSHQTNRTIVLCSRRCVDCNMSVRFQNFLGHITKTTYTQLGVKTTHSCSGSNNQIYREKLNVWLNCMISGAYSIILLLCVCACVVLKASCNIEFWTSLPRAKLVINKQLRPIYLNVCKNLGQKIRPFLAENPRTLVPFPTSSVHRPHLAHT